ncbi:hypothetical protein BS78_01G480400 [Paspalum vaginatum]|nr:hypothetical protein BS78_01G480400 [Paspalum vaginatum]
MEEDEQAQQMPEAEGDKDGEGPAPEPVPLRCGRHPSQLLTGICSSCLTERLSSVGDQPEPEIVEVRGAAERADPTKLRKTLMLLFQLDDSAAAAGPAAHPSEGEQPGFQLRSGGGDRGAARKGPGSWLRSILPRRAMRWRRNGGSSAKEPSRRAEPVDPSASAVRVERKPSFRRSCEWMVPSRDRDPGRGALEPPRHSWDGSMVGRAFACSFACLEEPADAAGRVRRTNAEEAPGEARAAVAESSRNGARPDDPCADAPRLSGRRSCDSTDTGMAMPVSGVGRRRSNRWSRVWDRSITSPLKEFVKKGEHVLERSLSESRREVRRGKNAEAASDISGEIQPGRNGHAPGRASRSSLAASNGDAQSFRTDWLRNSKIGRSRSVHYTSPGNLDNGMLRFYLTPMRSTRTANRGRRRSSRLFARGLFGFI